jgi:hypothetical protein
VENTTSKTHHIQDGASRVVDKVADMIEDRTGAHEAADTVRSAAEYLREGDLRTLTSDLGRMARQHPGATLAIVALAGFLVARSLSRH